MPYLGALITNMSAILPRSNDPWVWDRPSDAAALSVAATRLSSMVMRRLTQARCIVRGWSQIKQAISQVEYRSLSAWKPYTWILVVFYYFSGWLGSLSFFAFFWEKTVSVGCVDEWSNLWITVNIRDLPWTISSALFERWYLRDADDVSYCPQPLSMLVHRLTCHMDQGIVGNYMVASHQKVKNSVTFQWPLKQIFTDHLLIRQNPCLAFLCRPPTIFLFIFNLFPLLAGFCAQDIWQTNSLTFHWLWLHQRISLTF